MIKQAKTGILRPGFSLPTVLVLSLAMAYWSYFFIVARTVGTARWAAWLVFAGAVGVYVLQLYTGNVSKYRRYLFVGIAVLFFPDFVAHLLETRGTMEVGAEEMFRNETPYCHIVTSMVILPFALTQKVIFPANTNWIYNMLIIWGAATLLIGRGWCSWVCFYGGWDDGISSLPKKTRMKIDLKNDKWRYFGFAMLAFVALASLGTLVPMYCEWLCPFKLFTEFGAVDSLRSYAAFITFILIFFGLVVVLPLMTKKRTQCMSFCPMGGLQSLLGKVNLYRVKIDKTKCTQCLACARVCPTMSIKEETIKGDSTGKTKGEPLITCTRCGECMNVCKQNAIDYAYVFCGTGTPTVWTRLYQWVEGESFIKRIFKPVIRTFDEILSARALFSFTAFFLGMVFLGSFGVGTMHRVINLIVNGSFLLK